MSKIIKFEGQFQIVVKNRDLDNIGQMNNKKMWRYLLLNSTDVDIQMEIAKTIKITGHHPLIVFDSHYDTTVMHKCTKLLMNHAVNIELSVNLFERIDEADVDTNKNALYYGTLSNTNFLALNEYQNIRSLVDIDTSFNKLDDEVDMSIVPSQWKDDEE